MLYIVKQMMVFFTAIYYALICLTMVESLPDGSKLDLERMRQLLSISLTLAINLLLCPTSPTTPIGST
jgi:hypothetical protein